MSAVYDWKIEVIRNGVTIGELTALDCEILFDENADVKRSGKITFPIGLETIEFDAFRDRIRPVMIKGTNESQLGKYMVISMPESLSDTGSVYQIEMYDETMILHQAAMESRVYYAAGTSYQAVIEALLVECGLYDYSFTPTVSVLNSDREFAPGENYLKIINTLLDEINYEHIHAGLDGVLYLVPKVSKSSADHVYTDRRAYGLMKPIHRDTDIFSLPNVLVGVVSNPDEDTPLIYKIENTDPSSKISIPSRGYKVTKIYKLSNIASQQDLEDYITAEYLKSTQTTETAEFDTAAEPGHEFGDMVSLSTELISGLYREVGWSMRLGVRETMHHKLERKVFV